MRCKVHDKTKLPALLAHFIGNLFASQLRQCINLFVYATHTHTHTERMPPFSMVRRGAHKDFSIMKKNAQLTGGHLSLATACGSNSSSRSSTSRWRQPAAGLPPSNLIEFNICRCILYIGLCSYTIYMLISWVSAADHITLSPFKT